MTQIRFERDGDQDGIRDVLNAAFSGPDESQLVDALRADGDILVSMVADEDGEIVGHIAFSRLEIPSLNGDSAIRGAALAPVAVAPTHQRLGIGSELVRQGIENCQELDLDAIVVLGDVKFYRRFGFNAEMAKCLKSPFSGQNLMILPFFDGVLDEFEGRTIYPPAFGPLSDT